MSNEVMPILPGLQWNVKKKPTWKTMVREAASGREYRGTNWSAPRWEYELSYEFLRTGARGTELQQILGFFNRHKGSWDSWLYVDPHDNAVVSQQFGIGDGVTTQYQLVRDYGNYIEPVYDLSGTPNLYYAGNAAGVNLLTNGSFDGSIGAGVAANWSAYNNGTVGSVSYAIQNVAGQFGSSCQYMEASTLGTTASDRLGVKVTSSLDVTSLAGKPYCFSAFIHPSSANPKFSLYIAWYTSTMTFIRQDISTVAIASGVWSQKSMTGTAPSNAAFANVFYWFEQNAGGGLFGSHIDGAQLWQGSSPTDFIAGEYKYTIGANGLVTFVNPPGSGVALTWTGGYYWRCRFSQDYLDSSEFMKDLVELRQLRFITTKP